MSSSAQLLIAFKVMKLFHPSFRNLNVWAVKENIVSFVTDRIMEKLSAKFKKNKNVPMIVVSVQSVMQVGSKLQVVIMCNAKFANTASATSAAEKNVKLINV